MMAFCEQCGRDLGTPTGAFCRSCGARTGSNPPGPGRDTTEGRAAPVPGDSLGARDPGGAPTPASGDPGTRRPARRPGLVVALVAVLLVAAAAGAWLLVGGSGEDPVERAAEDPEAAVAAPGGWAWLSEIDAGDPGPAGPLEVFTSSAGLPEGFPYDVWPLQDPPAQVEGVWVRQGSMMAMLLTDESGQSALVVPSGIRDLDEADVTRTAGVATGIEGWQTLVGDPSQLPARPPAIYPLQPTRGLYVVLDRCRPDECERPWLATVWRIAGPRHHSMTKAEAVDALVERAVASPAEGSPDYPVVPIVKGGEVAMLVTMPEDSRYGAGVKLATTGGLQDVAQGEVTMTGDKATGLAGHETLNLGTLLGNQDYEQQWTDLRVPLDEPAITFLEASNIFEAKEFQSGRVYNEADDTITDTDTGATYRADDEQGLFVSETGDPLLTVGMPVGWRPGT